MTYLTGRHIKIAHPANRRTPRDIPPPAQAEEEVEVGAGSCGETGYSGS